MTEHAKRAHPFWGSWTVILLLLFWTFVGIHFVHAGEADLTIRFRNSSGQAIETLPDLQVTSESTVTLPEVPVELPAEAQEIMGSPAWKLTVSIEKEAGQYLEAGQRMSKDQLLELSERYGNQGVLTLYVPEVQEIEYYDSSGEIFYGKDYIFEGTYGRLRTSPDPENPLLYGWAQNANADIEWRYFGAGYTFRKNLKLYAVSYVQIIFCNANGETNRTYQGYTIVQKKNRYVTLPAVPSESTSYLNLGWSTRSGSQSPEYRGKETIRLTQNMTLYACRKHTPVTVRFGDSNGASKEKAFSRLWQHVAQETITMPQVPYKNGYVGIGWSSKRNQTEAEYEAGDQVYITKSTRYYAVYRKAKSFTIRFYMDGSSDNKPMYEDMTRIVYEDSLLTLPAIPERAGYLNVGWRLRVDGEVKLYAPGTRIRVKAGYRFYARQKETASVVLHYNDGSIYKNIATEIGTSCVLPAMENPEGYTFLGWGTAPKGIVSPSRPVSQNFYEAGESVENVTGTTNLYAVLSDRSRELSLTGAQIASFEPSRYGKVIFIGDSRTVRMGQTLQNVSGYDSSDVIFLASNGSKLGWLQNTGLPRLREILEELNETQTMPTAVVFNHGVNDLEAVSEYITYMNHIGAELQENNCQLFYMSVNPLNSVQLQAASFRMRTEASVREFNRRLQTGLTGYTFIDTYSWLMNTGYSTDRGNNGFDTGVDDGLHYTVNTYKRIFDRAIRAINAGGR